MKKLLPILLISGCVAVEENDRICLDWRSSTEPVERCIPVYGTMICATEERTRYWCVLYEEENE
jgi:hypothetical protein